MPTLTPAARRELRARAHALHPVVAIGHHGLTPAVLHEIDVALTAHELVKVRVFNDDRDERASMLQRISAEVNCAPVQHLGKILVVWRPAPVEVGAEIPARARSAPTRSRKAPQARHPRTPLPRVPSRPAPRQPPRGSGAKPTSRRRSPDGKVSATAKPHFGKPPRSVTAAMLDGDAHARRRPRDATAAAKFGAGRAGPKSRAPRDGGYGGAETSRKGPPRGAGAGKIRSRADTGTGAAAGARRRRTPR